MHGFYYFTGEVSLYTVDCLVCVVVNGGDDAVEGNGALMIGGGGTDLADCVIVCVIMVGVGIMTITPPFGVMYLTYCRL